jgi:8-oxo-dGTP pyrophosphatase MutT (NUDIX family)
MKPPVFNNTPNEEIETTDGRKLFNSRSPTICVPVLALDNKGDAYLLISRRGNGTPDFQGYYNLVVGYLDFDETLEDAAKRELWEEVGLHVDAIPDENVLYSLEVDPWAIKSKPTGKQNVTVRFGLILKYESFEDFPVPSMTNCEPGEVSEAFWIKHEDALAIMKPCEGADPEKEKLWAFGHHSVYREFIKKMEYILTRYKS